MAPQGNVILEDIGGFLSIILTDAAAMAATHPELKFPGKCSLPPINHSSLHFENVVVSSWAFKPQQNSSSPNNLGHFSIL